MCLVKKNKLMLLTVPGLVIICLGLFIPLLKVIFPTLFSGDFLLSNYLNFFKDAYFRGIFVRTVKIAILATVTCVIIGVPMAYFISLTSKKWQGFFLALSLFPLMTNSVVRSFAWINILGSNGIINKALMRLGLINAPVTLLYTEFAIYIGSVYLFLPLMIVTVAGAMENIHTDLMEAARSLGANPLKAFMKVVFPLSLPGIIVGSVLVFTGTLTAYTTPQLLGGNRRLVLSTLIYQRAMAVSDWSGAAVIALIMIIVTLIVIKGLNFVASRMDKRGIENE